MLLDIDRTLRLSLCDFIHIIIKLKSFLILISIQIKVTFIEAMKWIKITEVKKTNLINWFESVKSKGYIVVGLEQTTNSVQIETYDFPKEWNLLFN